MSDELSATADAPDWELARALYLRGGLTHSQIAREAGVSLAALRKRIDRQAWTLLKAKTNQLTKVSVADRAEAVRSLLAADIHQSAETLSKIPHSKSPSKFQARQDAANAVVAGAAKVFAWSQRSPLSFDIALLESAVVVHQAEPNPDAITVEFLENGETRLTQHGKLLTDDPIAPSEPSAPADPL